MVGSCVPAVVEDLYGGEFDAPVGGNKKLVAGSLHLPRCRRLVFLFCYRRVVSLGRRMTTFPVYVWVGS